MDEEWIDNQGVKLHCLTNKKRGPNTISLLFVPGIMMPAWIWDKQLEYFSENYHVIAMEPRSQGDSDLSSDGHYALAMAKDIQAVVDAFHVEHLIIIGWSIGVPQVVNYAVHCDSKKLIGLVLIDGIVGANPTLPFYQSMIDLWSQFQMERVLNTRKFITSIFKNPQNKQFLDKLHGVALRTPTNTVMTLINNYILQDFRPKLSQIELPTWIATIDGPRLEYMRQMEQLLPNAYLEIFDSAGHALFVDQPEKFNCFLERFINQVIQK